MQEKPLAKFYRAIVFTVHWPIQTASVHLVVVGM